MKQKDKKKHDQPRLKHLELAYQRIEVMEPSYKSDAELRSQLANCYISDNWERVCRMFQCPISTTSIYILVHLYDLRDECKGDIC